LPASSNADLLLSAFSHGALRCQKRQAVLAFNATRLQLCGKLARFGERGEAGQGEARPTERGARINRPLGNVDDEQGGEREVRAGHWLSPWSDP
jgi:hypothetical protein